MDKNERKQIIGDAIETKHSKQSIGWSYCLPEEIGDYLVAWVTSSGTKAVRVCWFDGNSWFTAETQERIIMQNTIYAWMPMPKPAKAPMVLELADNKDD